MNIKRTLKRLIDNTQYVAALEKQNDLLKKTFNRKKQPPKAEGELPEGEGTENCRRRGTVQET